MKRIDTLDGLRCFAVLAVVIHHYAPAASSLKLSGIPWGFIGVQLFFVLSGFLITSLLTTRYDLDGNRVRALGAFWISRFFRVAPLIYVALGFLALWPFTGKTPALFIHNLTFTVAYMANETGYFPPWTGHFWTLTSEMAFYLGWPLVWIITPARHRFMAAVLIAAGVTAFRPLLDAQPGLMPWILPAPRMDAFAIGAALALLPTTDIIKTAQRLLLVGAVLTIPSWALSTFGHYSTPVFPMDTAANLMFGGLILAAIHVPKMGWLGWTPLAYIGRISFGLYVWHHLLSVMEAPVLSVTHWSSAWTWAWLFPIAFGLSAVTFEVVERPFIRLSHRLGARLMAGRAKIRRGSVMPALPRAEADLRSDVIGST